MIVLLCLKMSCKFVILTIGFFIVSLVLTVLGGVTLWNNTNKDVVTACEYVWGYDLLSTLINGTQTIYCLIMIVFAIVKSDAQKRDRVIGYMISQIIILIFGAVICKKKRRNIWISYWRIFFIE